MNGQVVLEDLFEKVEFVYNSADNLKDYNLIKIKGLSEGVYALNLKYVNQPV